MSNLTSPFDTRNFVESITKDGIKVLRSRVSEPAVGSNGGPYQTSVFPPQSEVLKNDGNQAAAPAR